MGIIPAAALDVAASYLADVFAAPPPVALATVLAILTAIGLHLLGDRRGARRPFDGMAPWLLRQRFELSPRAAVAMLPRLPQRVPQTRTPRPAPLPNVAACRLMRGPPGIVSPSRQPDIGEGNLPR